MPRIHWFCDIRLNKVTGNHDWIRNVRVSQLSPQNALMSSLQIRLQGDHILISGVQMHHWEIKLCLKSPLESCVTLRSEPSFYELILQKCGT